MFNGLPEEAATWREDRPGWSQQDELLATCAELIDAWGRQLLSALVAVHGGSIGSLGEPLRIGHPDREEPEPEPPPKRAVTTDPSRISAFLRP